MGRKRQAVEVDTPITPLKGILNLFYLTIFELYNVANLTVVNGLPGKSSSHDFF